MEIIAAIVVFEIAVIFMIIVAIVCILVFLIPVIGKYLGGFIVLISLIYGIINLLEQRKTEEMIVYQLI